MSKPDLSNEQHDRLMDLVIQKVTTGLEDSEQQEFDHLKFSPENQNELEQFELAAAAFDLSFAADRERMPSDLHDRLLVSAGKFFGSTVDAAVRTAPSMIDSPKVERAGSKSNPASGPSWREIFSVFVAAASLLLLLSGFNPFARKGPPPPTAMAMLESFQDSKPGDLVDVSWTPVHDPDAKGKVLWSDEKQEGYMVFSGLDVNDPKVKQYQLWIFDTDVEQEIPVDGGVFDIRQSDIGKNGEVVIPIHPHVPVDRAVQFAVTKEDPGGVYHSKREIIPVLATVKNTK